MLPCGLRADGRRIPNQLPASSIVSPTPGGVLQADVAGSTVRHVVDPRAWSRIRRADLRAAVPGDRGASRPGAVLAHKASERSTGSREGPTAGAQRSARGERIATNAASRVRAREDQTGQDPRPGQAFWFAGDTRAREGSRRRNERALPDPVGRVRALRGVRLERRRQRKLRRRSFSGELDVRPTPSHPPPDFPSRSPS